MCMQWESIRSGRSVLRARQRADRLAGQHGREAQRAFGRLLARLEGGGLILLGDDVWSRPADWTGRRKAVYVRLTHDQSALVRAPWRASEGADESLERATPISQLTCVSVAKGARPSLRVQGEGGGSSRETLSFESASEELAARWAAALARLVAIVKQRHSYERLYGGTEANTFSPRTVASVAS